MKKYNLIVITPDQLRADYLSCYGHQTINTKHIDTLAKKGIKFEKMYCAAPLCGPSRCSFATSTYFSEHNHRNYGSTITPDVPNLVTSLKREGYRTGMFGKNHLFTYSRLGELWDELDEICLGNYDEHPDYLHSFTAFTLDKDHPYNITERLTTEAIDFVEKNQEQPFFVWINYQDPHPAFCCPPPYDTLFDPESIEIPEAYYKYDKDKQPIRNEVFRVHSEMDLCTEDDLRKTIAHYMGQVRYVDDSVGRILECLSRTGKDKDTLILFFSDHGELLGDYGMTHKNPTFYDCLSRIPTLLVHPDGKYEDVTFTGLTEEVDIVPTVLEMLGVPIPPTMVGTSYVEALENKDYSGKETIICEAGGGSPTYKEPLPGYTINAPHVPTSFGVGAMIRKGDFKLSIYGDDLCELYNLEEDPHELHNLYEEEAYEKVKNELTLLLLKRTMSVKVRDIGSMQWQYDAYPYDVRFEPLQQGRNDFHK